jgi:hypothetical protein
MEDVRMYKIAAICFYLSGFFIALAAFSNSTSREELLGGLILGLIFVMEGQIMYIRDTLNRMSKLT